MNVAAISHRPTEDYIRPEGRDSLAIELTAARGDCKTVSLWYWPRGEDDPKKRQKREMALSLRDAYKDYYRENYHAWDLRLHALLLLSGDRGRNAVARRQGISDERTGHTGKLLRVPVAESLRLRSGASLGKGTDILSDFPRALL